MQYIKIKLQSKHLVIFSVISIFLFIYLSGVPSSNTGYADSDMFITTGYHLGVAHPPGYQLYLLLLYVATHSALPLTIAFKAHALSALIHSITLGIITWTINKSLVYFNKSSSLQYLLVAGIATAFLGFSFLFWTHSIIAEKYALNNLFASLLIAYGVYFITTKNISKNAWIGLATILGFALTYHQTIILVLPFLIITATKHKQSLWLHKNSVLAIFLTTLAVSYATLFLINTNTAPMSWHFEPTVKGFVNQITRRELAGFLDDREESRSLYLMNLSPKRVVSQIPMLINQLLEQFGYIGTSLFALGIFFLIKNRSQFLAKSLLVLIFITTISIPLYLPWSSEIARQATIQRQFLLAFLSVPFAIAFGIHTLKRYQKLVLPFLITVVAFSAYKTYPQTNLKTFSYISQKYQNMLTRLPNNSLLLCQSDVSCFALLYEQFINNNRLDVVIIPSAHIFVRDYLENARLSPVRYSQKPMLPINYIAWNIKNKPIYITDLQKSYHDLLGFEHGALYYTPEEYAGRITLDRQTETPVSNYQLTQTLASVEFPQKDLQRQQLLASTLYAHLLNARMFAYQNQRKETQAEIMLGSKIAAKLPASYQLATKTHAIEVENIKINPLPIIEGSQFSHENILANMRILNSNPQKAFMVGLMGLIRFPQSLEIHQKIKEIYQTTDAIEQAKEEQSVIDALIKLGPNYIFPARNK